MGYIIVAEFEPELEVNSFKKLKDLIENPRIRILRRDDYEGRIELDIKGDYSTRIEDTRWFCNALIDAGIVSFRISHSY